MIGCRRQNSVNCVSRAIQKKCLRYQNDWSNCKSKSLWKNRKKHRENWFCLRWYCKLAPIIYLIFIFKLLKLNSLFFFIDQTQCSTCRIFIIPADPIDSELFVQSPIGTNRRSNCELIIPSTSRYRKYPPRLCWFATEFTPRIWTSCKRIGFHLCSLMQTLGCFYWKSF